MFIQYSFTPIIKNQCWEISFHVTSSSNFYIFLWCRRKSGNLVAFMPPTNILYVLCVQSGNIGFFKYFLGGQFTFLVYYISDFSQSSIYVNPKANLLSVFDFFFLVQWYLSNLFANSNVVLPSIINLTISSLLFEVLSYLQHGFGSLKIDIGNYINMYIYLQ